MLQHSDLHQVVWSTKTLSFTCWELASILCLCLIINRVYLCTHKVYLNQQGIIKEGSDSEPVPAGNVLLILLHDCLISLPAQGNFASRHICTILSATTQTFNREAASWRIGSDLKPGCISPNKSCVPIQGLHPSRTSPLQSPWRRVLGETCRLRQPLLNGTV